MIPTIEFIIYFRQTNQKFRSRNLVQSSLLQDFIFIKQVFEQKRNDQKIV